MYPAGYEKYVAICRRLEMSPEDRIAKFAARYKFAGQLKSIEILQTSEKSEKAYLETLRLSLAYSAFETLVAARKNKGQISVKSVKLAETYKSFHLDKLNEFLTVHTNDSSLSESLKKFRNSKGDSNLLPVIIAIRHLMFHGVLNPTAAGLTNRVPQAFVDNLCKELFKEMDRQMQKYLDDFIESLQAGPQAAKNSH